MRSIIKDWITQSEGVVFESEYSSVAAALAQLPKQKPNVLLVDINLGGQSGIDCVRQLKPLMPKTQFLMVTVFEDGDHIFDALTAGASGYLLKGMLKEELLTAIRQVHEGGSPMTSYIARKVVQWFQKPAPTTQGPLVELSPRERELLRLLAHGYAYKEMAEALGVSLGTINTHVHRIYQKLHVRSRGEAVALVANFSGELRRNPGARP